MNTYSNSVTLTDVSISDVGEKSFKSSPSTPKRKYVKRLVINKKDLKTLSLKIYNKKVEQGPKKIT